MLLFCSIVRAYVLFWVELSLGWESTAVIKAVLTYTTVSVMDCFFFLVLWFPVVFCGSYLMCHGLLSTSFVIFPAFFGFPYQFHLCLVSFPSLVFLSLCHSLPLCKFDCPLAALCHLYSYPCSQCFFGLCLLSFLYTCTSLPAIYWLNFVTCVLDFVYLISDLLIIITFCSFSCLPPHALHLDPFSFKTQSVWGIIAALINR